MSTDDIDDEPADDAEPSICSTCNGSGEGYADGTRCRSCRGRGETIDFEAEDERAVAHADWLYDQQKDARAERARSER
jgi:RecJ-like exonuclease